MKKKPNSNKMIGEPKETKESKDDKKICITCCGVGMIAGYFCPTCKDSKGRTKK